MGDVLLKSPLLGAGLPSPSILTGNFRPQTAAAFVEQTLAEAKARAAGGSRMGTPALSTHSQGHPAPKGSAEEVSALRSMASKHLGHLRLTPPSPYVPQHPPLPSRCLSTPPLRPQPSTAATATTPRTPAAPPLTPSASALFPTTAGSPALTAAAAPPAPAAAPPPLEPSIRELLPAAAGLGGGGAASATPRPAVSALQHTGRFGGGSGGGAGVDSPTGCPTVIVNTTGGASALLNIEGLHAQGITACSSHPFFATHVPAPAPTLPRLVLPPDETLPPPPPPPPPALPPPPQSPQSPPAAPPGPSTGITAPGAGVPSVAWASGVADPGTSPYSSRAAPTLGSPSGAPPQRVPNTPYPHPHSQVARLYSHPSAPSSRPGTGLSIQDLTLPKPASRMGGRSPTRGSVAQILDLSRAGSAASGVGGRLDVARQSSPAALSQQHPGNGSYFAPSETARSSNAGGSSSAVASPNRGGMRFAHTVTRWASEAAAAAQGGQSEATPRPGGGGGLKVTRGMLYSVFQELDEFDSGRLTYSAFEQAACKIGMRPAQCKRLFEHLDPQSRGFATMREWSSPHLQRQMEAFTRLYLQATRGPDGRPKDVAEVRSMHMAIQMAMTKLQLRRSGRAVSLDRLVQAFSYMDRDSNGALNAEEVEDALNSLGIFVTKEVVDTIMRTFDKDGNGCIDYYEFCKSLYPTLDSSAYPH